jgi:putative heme iron utilization protein
MNQLEVAQAEYKKFPEKFASVAIATVAATGIPHASYAPFVMDSAKNIYIFVSGLSYHTRNLHNTPKASVLFVEDESQTQQIFARRRLTFDCDAALLPRETPEWENIATEFEQRFGEIINMMRSLPDFRIFQLTPYAGQFTIGFGAAYQISGDDLDNLIHIAPENK